MHTMEGRSVADVFLGDSLNEVTNVNRIDMAHNKMSFMSDSKQIWYGIAAIAVVLLVGWAFMNRSSPADSVPVADTDKQATSTKTTPSAGGVKKTTGASKLPAGWGTDAPALQPGAVISYSGGTNPKTGALGPTVVYTVKGTAQDAINYYKAQFTNKGWIFRGQGNAEGSVQLAATKDTRKVTVGILETTPGVLTVTIGITRL